MVFLPPFLNPPLVPSEVHGDLRGARLLHLERRPGYLYVICIPIILYQHMCIYIYIGVAITYIYIYMIERETYVYIYIYIHMYVVYVNCVILNII